MVAVNPLTVYFQVSVYLYDHVQSTYMCKYLVTNKINNFRGINIVFCIQISPVNLRFIFTSNKLLQNLFYLLPPR